MAKIKGRDLIIFRAGQAIAYQKDCTFETDCDIEEKASSTQSTYKEYYAKRKSWKMSCNCLLPSTMTDPASLVGTEVMVSMSLSTSPSEGIDATKRTQETILASGYAIITSGKINGANTGNVTWSLDFQGTGALSNQ